MAGKKPSSLDKVLDRLDRLDAAGLRTLVQRLARERTLLETVFNTLQEGVLVITADGEIDYANAAAARLIGFKEEAGTEKILWRLVPGLRDEAPGHWQAILAGQWPGAVSLPALGRRNIDLAARLVQIEEAVQAIKGPLVVVAHSAGAAVALCAPSTTTSGAARSVS